MPKKDKSNNINTIHYKAGLGRINKDDPYTYRFMYKGKIYTGSTGVYNFEDAKKWLLKYKSDLSLNNIDLKADISKFKISDILSEWKIYAAKKRMTDKYINHVEQRVNDHVIPVIGDKLIRSLNTSDMKKIVATYLSGTFHNKKRSENGVNNLLMHLASIITYAEEQEYLVKRPKFPYVEAQEKEKKFIPKDKIPEFLKAIDAEKEEHLSIMVRFCLLHGLRESEARSMKWSQINLENQTFKLDKQKNKKFTGNIKLAASLLPIITNLKNKHDSNMIKSIFLFPANTKEGYRSRNYMVVLLNKVSNKVLGFKLSTHGLRRSFITNLSTSNVDTFTLMNLARHANITTTQKYVVAQEKKQQEAIEIMDQIATSKTS